MRLLLITLALLCASSLAAVEPDEVLADPELEARARALSAELRCVVCRNESIDESRATIAKDMRLLVRERLEAGDGDDEVLAFMTERYGEFVLLRPPVSGSTIILWATPIGLLLIGLGLGLVYIRQRRGADHGVEQLSTDEAARLQELMKE